MSKKAGIWIGVGVVLLILIVWIGMTASAISSEASAADSYLKGAVANKTPQAQVEQKLRDMGFTVTDSPGAAAGTGPTHSLLVYSTHLVANLTFDKDGNTHSYHLDRG